MNNSTIYIGGLSSEVTQELVTSLCLPFGELVHVELPRDAGQQLRGFALVQFEEAEDAAHAIDNLHDAEWFGRVLKVNVSKPVTRMKAVWEANPEAFYGDDGDGDGAAAGDDGAAPASKKAKTGASKREV